LATKCLDRPTCFLWHGDGRPGPVMQKLSEGLTALAWGPDGRLASGHEKTVRVWNVNNGDLAWEWRGLEQAATILAWSPDGKHLASSGADKIIHVWDVDQSRHFQTAAAHPGTVDQLAWNSDSTKIASLSRAENCVRLWNADATAGPVLSVGESSARQFAWTPDIQQIAVLPEKGVLRLFNTAGEKVLEVPNADAFVEWSPDGKWLAAGSYQHPNFTGLRIFSRDGAGRPGPRLEFWEIDSEAFWRPDWRRWSPDGKWLAVNHVHDATVRLWDVKANRYSPVLEGNPKPCSAVCWSSDSQHLLTFNEDQTFRYWDVGSGRILATTVFLPNEQWARITDDGRVEVSGPEAEKELVYVLEDSSGAQKIYSVAEFRALAAKQTATSR
jgi:WD40 repeat protein